MIALSLLLANSAGAMTFCGDRDDMARALDKQHRERKTVESVTDHGEALEVYVSPDRTWTILVLRTDGSACFVTAGNSWETMEPQAPPPITQVH